MPQNPDASVTSITSHGAALDAAARHDDGGTADEHLLATPHPAEAAFIHTDPWRVLRIMGEFVKGFDVLAGLPPAVTLFGSARVNADDPMYHAAFEVARL